MTALTTLANVKANLGLATDNTTDDALLTRIINAESASIEQYVGRSLLSTSYTQTFDGNGGRMFVLPQYPVTAVSAVKVDGISLPAAVAYSDVGFRLANGAVILTGYSFTRGFGNVEITFTAGHAAVPADVEQACIELASLTYRERDRIGLSSKGMAGETTAYIVKAMPESVRGLLDNHVKVFPG